MVHGINGPREFEEISRLPTGLPLALQPIEGATSARALQHLCPSATNPSTPTYNDLSELADILNSIHRS